MPGLEGTYQAVERPQVEGRKGTSPQAVCVCVRVCVYVCVCVCEREYARAQAG
jgi:hypothetical protein